jgi:FMN phosphatase YigB (HAD superfamily)
VSSKAKLPLAGTLEAVTFDCWNTLLYEEDWQAAHTRRVAALHDAATAAGHATLRDEAERAFDAAWSRHIALWRQEQASGAVEVARWSLEILGIAPEGLAFEQLVADWQEASHTSRVAALPGARPLLARLRARGIRTALICDTGLTPGRVVRRLLARQGLLERLERQVFSDEVGVPKPHAHVFAAALEPLGVAPGRSVHVGDLRRTDVAGGRAAGMGTVRLRARFDDLEPLPEADAVVDTHAELAALLGVDEV